MANGSRTGKINLCMQSEAAECGLACVLMVASYYGQHNDLIDARRTMGISSSGANLRSIMGLAESIGLTARPVKVDLTAIGQLKLPAIIHWDFDHFVVLSKARSNQIEIYDPAVGVRRYSLDDFSKHFTGVALELAPRKEFRQEDNSKKLSLLAFWGQTAGLRSSLVLVLVLSVLVQIFALSMPFYMQVVVDEVLSKNDKDLVTILALGFLAVTLINVLTTAVRSYANLFISNQLSFNMGNSVLHHLLRLPLDYFKKRHIGDLISRVGSLKPLQDFLTNGFISGIIDGLLALLTIALMFFYSAKLASVVIIAALLYSAFRIIQFRSLRAANMEHLVAEAKVESTFIETVRSVQGVKLAAKELDRQTVWANQFSRAIDTGAKVERLDITRESVHGVTQGVEYILIVYLGAKIVLAGGMTIGMLFAFIAYRAHFSKSFTSIVDLLLEYLMIGLHLERLSDITRTEKEVGSDRKSKLLLPIEGSIEVSDLSYRYSNNDPLIFSDLNLTVEAGEFVSIFGASGSGKTSLLTVLMGLSEPSSGSISIDGMDLKSLGMSSYRAQISAVMQEDTLFSGSLLENITFFDLSPDIKRVRQVCIAADILHEIERMPMSFDTLVTDMGTSLSVGQQQRVLMARALYQQPKVLFLDEGTAHVGKESELKIMNALRAMPITCIFVTHNPSLLSLADKVVIWSRRTGMPVVRKPADLFAKKSRVTQLKNARLGC
ncbi:MAG: peptidase domain-containing ABC transporter [Pseudomonadales bacterium]